MAFVVSLIPAYSRVRRFMFEGSRWKDSMYTSAASYSSEDSDETGLDDDKPITLGLT